MYKNSTNKSQTGYVHRNGVMPMNGVKNADKTY